MIFDVSERGRTDDDEFPSLFRLTLAVDPRYSRVH
jgi:hypothetical protein